MPFAGRRGSLIRSFRWRVVAMSTLVSGAALATFATSAWLAARASRIEAGRRILRSFAQREAESMEPRPWPLTESDLRRSLGVRSDGAAVAWLVDLRGLPGWRSKPWADGLPSPVPPGDAATRPASGDPGPPGRRSPPFTPGEYEDPFDGFPPMPLFPRDGPRPVSVVTDTQIRTGGRRWLVCTARSGHRAVVAAWDLAEVGAELSRLERAFLISLPAALVLVAAGAWLLSAGALRPISSLARALREVEARGLDRRLERNGGDREFDQLVDGINGMLARLEPSFRQSQRFSADAAHEMRTPLTIIQGQIERILDSAPTGSPLQVELSSVIDEVRRLTSIIGKLLLLSRADGGTLRPALETFAADKVLESLVEDLRLLAPHLEIHLKCTEGLTIRADPVLLEQVLLNLGSNAIKYNVEGGWILATAAPGPEGGVEICLANSSVGIDPSDREKIFDRFYRADPARNRKVDGVGLGLSLAREIARAHKGDLSVDSKTDGTVVFTLRLPPSAG